jgi:hypothetical protein
LGLIEQHKGFCGLRFTGINPTDNAAAGNRPTVVATYKADGQATDLGRGIGHFSCALNPRFREPDIWTTTHHVDRKLLPSFEAFGDP